MKKIKKPWNFEDITKSLKKAVKFAYSTRRKNKTKDIPWDGPNLTITRILAGCFNINESLKEENLIYNEENQGRDALDIIISCAVQLGIEQGIRMKMEELNKNRFLMEINNNSDKLNTYIREGVIY